MKSIEDDIIEFLQYWNEEKLSNFYKSIMLLIELFDSEEEIDWIEESVGKENERNVRAIRLTYLISKFADFHAPELCRTNIKFKNLWKKIEKQGKEND